jgi:hypothetical protein
MPDAGPDALPDAGTDTYIAPDGASDASDANDSNVPEGSAPDVIVDAGSDASDAKDAGSLDASDAKDAGSDAKDGGSSNDVVSDANDGGLPPTCDYVIEAVPEATQPYALCGATVSSPNGIYQFSNLRFRQPFSPPRPIDAFVEGTMTVRNSSKTSTYTGRRWASTMGEEILFDGPNGAAIVFTTGVQEISVTTTDASGKVGCLPQPCTWTITQ